jgi:hypothetical protein
MEATPTPPVDNTPAQQETPNPWSVFPDEQAAVLKQFHHSLQAQLDAARLENAQLRAELAEMLSAIRVMGFSGGANKLEVPLPEKFNGKSELVESFISSIANYMELKKSSFPDERTKILWTLNLFDGAAKTWAESRLALFANPAKEDPFKTYANFQKEFQVAFGLHIRQDQAKHEVQFMKQGDKEPLGVFTNRFQSEADISGFEDTSLIHFFRQKLSYENVSKIIMLHNTQPGHQGSDGPEKIKDWYSLAHTVGRVNFNSRSEGKVPSQGHTAKRTFQLPVSNNIPNHQPSAVEKASDAMDIDGHRKAGLCFNCHRPGHLAKHCPKPKQTEHLRSGETKEEDPLVKAMRDLTHALLAKTSSSSGDFPQGQQ